MPRGYKRKRRHNRGRLAALIAIPLMVLFLALVWVWKANMVKDKYATMKRLETEKANLNSENLRLNASLMDLKSLSEISKVVTRRFGLTQEVSERVILSDPVSRGKKESKLKFASEKGIPDWIETAIMGAGKVMAESLSGKNNKGK